MTGTDVRRTVPHPQALAQTQEVVLQVATLNIHANGKNNAVQTAYSSALSCEPRRPARVQRRTPAYTLV